MSIRPIKLLICISSGRGWASRFGHSLSSLTLTLGLNRLKDEHGVPRLDRCGIAVAHGAYLVKSRNDHLTAALNGGFTHMLSLDDDMTFPVDIVERLLAHDKAVVTCNYRKKIIDKMDYCCMGLDGEMLSSLNKTGLEKIGSMGMGVTLIDLDKIRHVPGPYFAVIWNGDKNEYLIEDGVFSNLLRGYDVDLWCDHDASQLVGHVGEVEFLIPTVTSLGIVSKLEKPNEQVKAVR